ncbi:MAG: SHOCT domain-containing protein [Desulfobulbaceae bacterium]|nr:SHOCT domain-containing protein [Desulfobulbaceae bacterium]
MMGHWFNGSGFYGHNMTAHPLGWIFPVLFWVLVILGIIYFVKLLMGKSTHDDTALDILRRRYARGEISREEFIDLKKELSE